MNLDEYNRERKTEKKKKKKKRNKKPPPNPLKTIHFRSFFDPK
jgi:hypothetical protein